MNISDNEWSTSVFLYFYFESKFLSKSSKTSLLFSYFFYEFTFTFCIPFSLKHSEKLHWFRGGRLAGRRVSWAYEFISFIWMQVQRLILCMEIVLRKSTRSSEAYKRVLFAFTPTLRFFFPSQKVLGIGIGQQPKRISLPASVSIILTLCVCI